jgi:hypothetical protein
MKKATTIALELLIPAACGSVLEKATVPPTREAEGMIVRRSLAMRRTTVLGYVLQCDVLAETGASRSMRATSPVSAFTRVRMFDGSGAATMQKPRLVAHVRLDPPA